jgi:hypothetical protein
LTKVDDRQETLVAPSALGSFIASYLNRFPPGNREREAVRQQEEERIS